MSPTRRAAGVDHPHLLVADSVPSCTTSISMPLIIDLVSVNVTGFVGSTLAAPAAGERLANGWRKAGARRRECGGLAGSERVVGARAEQQRSGRDRNGK